MAKDEQRASQAEWGCGFFDCGCSGDGQIMCGMCGMCGNILLHARCKWQTVNGNAANNICEY